MACGYYSSIGKSLALCHYFFTSTSASIMGGLFSFGFGKTTMVPVEKRVKTWAMVVPKLLNALGIKHVALMSHSAGTIYLLNVLWHCRQILHPEHPQVVFFGQ